MKYPCLGECRPLIVGAECLSNINELQLVSNYKPCTTNGETEAYIKEVGQGQTVSLGKGLILRDSVSLGNNSLTSVESQ